MVRECNKVIQLFAYSSSVINMQMRLNHQHNPRSQIKFSCMTVFQSTTKAIKILLPDICISDNTFYEDIPQNNINYQNQTSLAFKLNC